MNHVSSHPLLTIAECGRVQATLYHLRHAWIPRAQADHEVTCEFHTLGRASYLDVFWSGQPEADYYQKVEENNRMLQARFEFVWKRLQRCIEDALGSPVFYSTTLAMPGFHIFTGANIVMLTKALPHFDFQHLYLRVDPGCDGRHAISFTLPIALPEVGGGLDTWSVTKEEYDQLNDRERDELLKRKVLHNYALGTLVIQHGHILHRGGYTGETTAEDTRITLQGHGLRCGAQWMLYW